MKYKMDEIAQLIESDPGKAIKVIAVLRDYWKGVSSKVGHAPGYDFELAAAGLAAFDRLEVIALRSICNTAVDVCRRLIDDREACGIDESDKDDPLARLVGYARNAVAKAEGRES